MKKSTSSLRERFAQFADCQPSAPAPLVASQREQVHKALHLLTLIETAAEAVDYMDSCEGVDKFRRAIRDAAAAATFELEMAFGLHWLPEESPSHGRRVVRLAAGGRS